MPFKSDKQRRYLWSQKPEVARQIAYKQDGGGVYGMHDQGAEWWNKRMAGVPQHRGYADDPDDITEMIGQNPDDPYTMANPDAINPSVPRPGHYVDMATYYKPGYRKLGVGADMKMKQQVNNERIRQQAIERGFVNEDGSLNFNDGGSVPMGKNIKKVTQRDRYGNQTTVEYEPDEKPLDKTALAKSAMEMLAEGGGVPAMVGIGTDHPGEPRGSDTVPAWLTPGEFVVNREAMSDPQAAAIVEKINNMGRMKQNAMGMQEGGPVDDSQDFAGPEQLSEQEIMARMEAMRGQQQAPVPVPMPAPWSGRPEGYTDLLHEREGFRDDIYLDTLNKPTVGYGHLLPPEYASQVGERPFSQGQLDDWFEDDSARGVKDAIKNVGRKTWVGLNNEQKAALSSMAFQLGGEGQSKFKKMLEAVRAGDNAEVRKQARDSKWFEQTPARVADIEAAFRASGGPIYAYRGYDTAMQDAYDIEDPMADMSGDWMPPVVEDTGQWDEGDAALMENYEMLEPPVPMAMPDEMTGEAPADMGSIWGDIASWAGDTSVADARNAEFNEKAAAANAEAAEATLAEMKERQAAGEPVNEHTMSKVEDAVAHTKAQAVEAAMDNGNIHPDILDYEGVVAAEAELMANTSAPTQKPGKQDDKTRLEELAESEEYEDEDDPSKPSDNGQQTPEEVEAIGEEQPKDIIEKSKGFLKGAFSDLFDGKELARMAIMYAGSRALGYSHGGSLNWAAKQYVSRVDAKLSNREQNAKEFTKSGKYTPKSVAAYQKSGDLADLVSTTPSTKTTGSTMTRMVGGKPIAFQEVKDGAGNVLFQDPSGRTYTAAQLENNSAPYEASFQKGTPEYRTRRSRATNDAAGRFEEIYKSRGRERVGDNQWKDFTQIKPKQAADEFWAWAERNGLDPESDEALTIMTNAYDQAIEDGRANPKMIQRKLTPYLEAQFIREKTGSTELFETNPDREAGTIPSYVRGDKMHTLNNNVQTLAGMIPAMADMNPNDASSQIYDAAIQDWGDLPDIDKDKWNRSASEGESGFYYWLQNVKIPEMYRKLGG